MSTVCVKSLCLSPVSQSYVLPYFGEVKAVWVNCEQDVFTVEIPVKSVSISYEHMSYRLNIEKETCQLIRDLLQKISKLLEESGYSLQKLENCMKDFNETLSCGYLNVFKAQDSSLQVSEESQLVTLKVQIRQYAEINNTVIQFNGSRQ